MSHRTFLQVVVVVVIAATMSVATDADASHRCGHKGAACPPPPPPPPPPPTSPPSGLEGDVRVAKSVESDMEGDVAAAESDATLQAWWNAHYDRVRVYDYPALRADAAWLPPGWAYNDLYAIYAGQESGLEDFILLDASGQRLYIPYRCSSGSCPQYAADIGDPGWRAAYVAKAAETAAIYGGVFADDANFAGPGDAGEPMFVGNGSGAFVRPINERTGAPYTNDEWAADLLSLLREVKAAIGGRELVCNVVWWRYGGLANPIMRDAINVCDVMEIERGFNDAGIPAGGGTYGFDTLLAWIDQAHAVGHGVVLDAQTPTGEMYALGTFLLVASGRDFVDGPRMRPSEWWTGWDTDLGAALSGRERMADGTYQRRFERGTVHVDPSSQTATIG